MSYQIQAGDTKIAITSVTNAVGIYNVTVDVIRDTKVNSSTGVSLTPVTIVTSMPCRIRWTSGREKMMFNKDTHYLDAVLHCRVPAGVTIVTSDRIFYNDEYYEIVDVRDFRNLGVLLEITIKKVE